MDEALDFSVKKRCVQKSPSINGQPMVKEERRDNSPQASSSSSQSSQSPTSTSYNHPTPYNMFRAMGWDPTVAGGPFGLFGTNPLTPLPTSPTSVPGFFPHSFMAGGTAPDSSLYPTASLALSTLQRRRRSTPSVGSQDTESGGKKMNSIPDEKKDDAYWERRKKNNEAAKRSRDTRRCKEEEIAIRAAYLEQENLKLRAQVAILKNETAKLHFMLFNHVTPTA